MKVQMSILAGLCLLALSCGPRKTKAPVNPTRAFPSAEIPMMITEPAERMAWLGEHFWDRYTATDSLYYSDSVTVNGVPLEELEKQVGIFVTLLEQVAPEEGFTAMVNLYTRMEAFQTAFDGANMLQELTGLVSRYFYDPNSPVRSEELYLPFAQAMSACPLITALDRERYAYEARMCALNRPGTRAADFRFVDTAGHRHTLYDIKADMTLLVFGNPDCHACKELQASLENSVELSASIASGQLKVVDIYIDQDLEAWREHIPEYPASWINGYDPDFVIRTDLLYNVRALPSLYLLSADKTVLLKDATPEQFFAALGL